ncbi:FAD-dependent monooxygenase [Thermomonospora umbrina]|uniref:Oxygenase n=1 Tax=Thermomonospora umbrina TaxID=111806 RepID=A0A3D9SYC1_9ACTN|nr:FAD-dependent monooxygenase [Thermomonospora umbrina]REF00947.1 oxygenase [Thermomonospora umbrina]
MDADVIVVGAGPVGLMLAGELRLGGAEVVVLERLAEPADESRASTLHARTMEILDQRGLLAELGTPPNDGMGHFGGVPLDLTGLDTPYPGQWKVPQTRTEELLGRWAAGLGADIRRDHEVTALTDTPDGVQVEVAGRGALHAAYLVGCDGQDGAVRGLAGFGFPGADATRELLRADVAGIEVPDRRFERLPAGLAIAARRADGVTRVMVHESGRTVPDRVGDPTFADVVKAWERVTGEDIGGGTPLWVNAFDNTRRQAEEYRRGRVLLAGDAAHRQMPVGGQALNLGLHDAVNLGWKLAAVVRAQAPPELLDTYHDERHAVGRRVLDNIEAQTLLLLGGAEVDATRKVLAELIDLPRARDRLAGMITGLDVRYPAEPADHALAGLRLPPTELRTADGTTTTTTALLRSGRGLLLDLGAGADDASPWSDRVDVVRAEPPASGPLAGIGAVLVRPDGHVAWVSGADDGPRAALRRWFGDG